MIAALLLVLPSLIDAFIGHGTAILPTRHPKTYEVARLNAEIQPAEAIQTTSTSSTVGKPSYKFYNSTLAPRTPELISYQSKHAPIASSFQPSTFSPLPLLSNRHLQTIGGVFLRSNPNLAYFKSLPSFLSGLFDTLLNIRDNEYITPTSSNDWYYDKRERILTPSGGAFFTVDHKYYRPSHADSMNDGKSASITTRESKGTVIIIHGLESNSNSSLCIDMSNAFLQRQYDVSVINFRGCCGTNASDLYNDGTLIRNGENTLMYHLGFVDDLIYYLKLLSSQQQQANDVFNNKHKPIYLSGFSLGANVILKALGQLGTEAIDLGITGAAVAGAPFDTERNYMQFHQDPISRMIYVENLLTKLKERAREILEVQYGGDIASAGFDYRGSMEANTIYELETACVAPLFGFEDHLDYYRKTSCGYFMDGICVPTYVVNARDDPFFDSRYVPWDKVWGGESGEDVGGGAPVKLAFTEEGGHLGYIFHQNDDHGETKSSWISEELARFVEHVDEQIFTKNNKAGSSSLPLL